MDIKLWKLFREHKLARTPHEERCRIVLISDKVSLVGSFAKDVLRLLQAALLLCNLTITITVVRGRPA
jgi:hypothetical protein